MATFIARVIALTWKYGTRAVNAVIAYAKKHSKWVLEQVAAYGVVATIEEILRRLGLRR